MAELNSAASGVLAMQYALGIKLQLVRKWSETGINRKCRDLFTQCDVHYRQEET